ncbi:Predicted kinase, aminoglycoside phosphotransferase (APT) family [Solimonas aquatica]|uniref:Predicted kinase, aminoglycoside phosphotransferase (APT) family n=1 Tax=Solimonas aquatica TaxID=489703 RepID=A0A1H9BG06_9GAMM|nr:phosphotransferase family protein [Solimonas aquatica]SEP87922.1 Predicted kinase, aminoglycoside phosphotransferase (APT) family [Solimonas aquatica]
MLAIDGNKDRPSPAFIAELRRRFPTEVEVDRVLTRKLQWRAGPGYRPLPLATLIEGVARLLRTQLQTPFAISDARWLAGGASKLQMAFMLEWHRPGAGEQRTPMVLRMEPAESIVETSRMREFQLIKALLGTVPVPPVFWCDAEAEYLPYPALIYGFARGVTKPATSSSGVSGLGTHLPPELRARLAPQFVEHLARIHTFDFRKAELSAFDVPSPGTQCAQWGVNWWERVWEEDSDEDVPLLRLAASWLRRHAPALDRASIVHADFRVGNFLFEEDSGVITAWLDWELGRIGDRHQDLAWTTSRAFGHYAEAGGPFLVCGLLDEAQFFAAYERASGLSVVPRTVHWYKVYNAYMMAVLLLGTGYRIARNGKTHQDVLVTWLMGIGYMLLDEMRELIERGA